MSRSTSTTGSTEQTGEDATRSGNQVPGRAGLGDMTPPRLASGDRAVEHQVDYGRVVSRRNSRHRGDGRARCSPITAAEVVMMKSSILSFNFIICCFVLTNPIRLRRVLGATPRSAVPGRCSSSSLTHPCRRPLGLNGTVARIRGGVHHPHPGPGATLPWLPTGVAVFFPVCSASIPCGRCSGTWARST